jgi:hypothetical protein
VGHDERYRAGGGDRLESAARWWAARLHPVHAAQMARKYATLLALVRDGDRARRDRGLRLAARHWPGSLRECQCVSPQRYAARLRASRRGANATGVARSVWRDRGCAAIPLWVELHHLLDDQLTWRAAGAPRGAHDPQGGVRGFVAMLGPAARTRWPDAAVLDRLGGSRLRPHHAYAWLAARAGLTLEELDALLFDRCAPIVPLA